MDMWKMPMNVNISHANRQGRGYNGTSPRQKSDGSHDYLADEARRAVRSYFDGQKHDMGEEGKIFVIPYPASIPSDVPAQLSYVPVNGNGHSIKVAEVFRGYEPQVLSVTPQTEDVSSGISPAELNQQLYASDSPVDIDNVAQPKKRRGLGRLVPALATAAVVTASTFLPIDRQGMADYARDTGSRIVYEMGEAAKGMGNATSPAKANAGEWKARAFLPIVTKNYDPSKLNAQLVIVAGYNNSWTDPTLRTQESKIEFEPLNWYHYVAKKSGFNDNQIGLFVRHYAGVVPSFYVCTFQQPFCDKRGLKDEDRVRSLLLDSKIANESTIDAYMRDWRSGIIGVGDDLLKGAQIDYEATTLDAGQMTRDNLFNYLRNMPTDENTVIYIVMENHGDAILDPNTMKKIGGKIGLSAYEIFTSSDFNDILKDKIHKEVRFIWNASFSGDGIDGIKLPNYIALASTPPNNEPPQNGVMLNSSLLLEDDPNITTREFLAKLGTMGGPVHYKTSDDKLLDEPFLVKP